MDAIPYYNELKLIISFVGGGGLLWLLQYWLSLKKDNRDGLTVIIDRLTAETTRLSNSCEAEKKAHDLTKDDLIQTKGELNGLLEKIGFFGGKLMELQDEIERLNLVDNESPIPMWRKNKNGVMLDLNRAYEKMFLIPKGKKRRDYVGFTDIEYWGEELGKEYANGDSEAIEKRSLITLFETVTIDNKITNMWVVKWPEFNGSEIIGTSGMAIPKTENI